MALLLMAGMGFCIASIIWRMMPSHGGKSNSVQFAIGLILLPLLILVLVVIFK